MTAVENFIWNFYLDLCGDDQWPFDIHRIRTCNAQSLAFSTGKWDDGYETRKSHVVKYEILISPCWKRNDPSTSRFPPLVSRRCPEITPYSAGSRLPSKHRFSPAGPPFPSRCSPDVNIFLISVNSLRCTDDATYRSQSAR